MEKKFYKSKEFYVGLLAALFLAARIANVSFGNEEIKQAMDLYIAIATPVMMIIRLFFTKTKLTL